MPSADFFRWQRAGEPYTDARPVATLARTLRGHGYTVYTRGNDDHMEAVPPEDHTPFSQTGWPVESPEWYGHADDIMPQGIPTGCPTLAQLGDQLFNDKTANVPGARLIKYMNWEPNGPGRACYHDAWEPTHKRTMSTDRGHIHVSFRSDATHSDEMAGYDPVQRWKDKNMAITSDDARKVWRTDGSVDNDWPAEYGGGGDTIQGTTAIQRVGMAARKGIDVGKANGLAIAALRDELVAIEARLRAGQAALMAAIADMQGPGAATYEMTGTLTPKVQP